MKITKRIFAFLMILIMLLGSIPVAAETGYRDVPADHWAITDIEWATAQGLMNGTDVNEFSPEAVAERAMPIMVLYRAAGTPTVRASTPFTDLQEDWYLQAVVWGYGNGIINGTTPTTFDPDDPLTREQLVTILYRYAKNTLQYNVTASGSLGSFPDVNDVSSYAEEAMLWAYAVGIINGMPKGGIPHLDPQGTATRAQMAAIFHRFDVFAETQETVLVPDLVGMTEAEATAAAKEVGLTVVFQRASAPVPAFEENVVVNQLTAANTAVPVGASIVLQLNIAPESLVVPDFTGMTRKQAAEAAASVGFGVRFVQGVYNSSKAEDTVLTQTPAAYTRRPADAVITLSMNLQSSAEEEPPVFRVASYNVKHFVHGSGINYEVFAREINKFNPDVIGLQEIDNGTTRSNGDDQMKEIAEATGYPYYYFGKSIDLQGGGYGHGILSKYPITKSETILFQAQTGEKRSVERHEIYMDLSKDGIDNGKTIVFYNTHLCYCGEDENQNNIVDNQPNQMAEIFAMMDRDTYPILVGDMNIEPMDFKDVIDVSRYTPLNGGKDLTNTINTYPQGSASYIPIDNIILSDNIEYLPTSSEPNGLVMSVTEISDHNMIFTDLMLKEELTVLPLGRVPDVVGMTVEKARETMVAEGFQIAFEAQSETDSEAVVFAQSVAAGTALEMGTTIGISARLVAKVPDLIGLSVESAKALLKEEGYSAVFTIDSNTTSDEAVITLQAPAFDTELEPGSTITLTARELYPEYLTVASYDVKKFKLEATTGKVEYEPFVEEVRALNPDILCLQAVEEGTTTNGEQTRKFADMLGYNYCYAPAIESYSGGSFGNSILSRFPILSASGGPFESQDGESRGYVRAVLDVSGVPVTVYNLMLNNTSESVRTAQLAQVTAMMAKDEFPLLMGNFNMTPDKLDGKLDLTAYTPLNGGKGLDQIVATWFSGEQLNYMSNIITSAPFEVATDESHPTGLYVSDAANCYHRMIWANIRMKNAMPTESAPGTPKVPNLIGLTIAEAQAKAEACGYVFSLAEDASQESNATISVQTPAAHRALATGGTITVNTRVLYGDYLSVANFDVQKMDLTNYTPFVQLIGELGPDIIGIQAIDHGTTQITVDCQLEHLAEQLGYEYVACGKAYAYKGGYLGNGIISKYPIMKQESGLFENQTTETRGWVRAEIDVQGTTVVAYSAKLSSGKTEAMDTLRAKQFAELYAMMEQDEFPVLTVNLSSEATMLNGKVNMAKYTPLNGGKSLENIQITAKSSAGENSSSNIIISDAFEYLADETIPYGLYVNDTVICDHRLISSYIRLKNAVLPETSRFIEVPDFIGMEQSEAEALVASKNLILTVQEGFNQNYIGKISAQSVAAGTRLSRGSSIVLTVGKELVDKTDYPDWLTIASYNVKSFIKGSQYDEIAAELQALNADIVGLQEIDHFTSRNNVEQMEIIAEEAGYDYWYFGKAVDYGGGEYGHGILSKYPIIKSETISFKEQYGEKRSYERHELYIDPTDDAADNGYTVAFYNTHLCLDPTKAVQNAQLQEILTAMEADTVPAVLVGDMNATPIQLKETVDATSIKMLNGGKDPDVNAITCHNGKPIDQIMISDEWDHFEYENGLGIMVSETEWSDHNMIYTYLKVKE